jgi:hypothetical protein
MLCTIDLTPYNPYANAVAFYPDEGKSYGYLLDQLPLTISKSFKSIGTFTISIEVTSKITTTKNFDISVTFGKAKTT